MRHLILCSVMWLCGLMMAVGQNVPQVIPALQQWKSAKRKTGTSGNWKSDCFFR